MKNYLCGAIPSPPDERDYTVCARAQKFPEEFRLQRLPRIKQQLVGDCVAHSSAYLFEYLFQKIFGAGFTYGYRPDGYSQNQGMIPRDAANTAVNAGNVLLSTYRKELEMPSMKKDVDKHLAQLLKLAAARKIASYARCFTINDIKTQLMAGNPVMFTAAISQEDALKSGVFPCTLPVLGYHQMSIWGWESVGGREMFYVANSWSERWGKKGFCYMTPDDILRVGDIIAYSATPDDTTIRRTLKVGLTGNDVFKLEKRLTEMGYKIAADGKYSEATESVVKDFQRKNNLKVSGTVGTATWKALGL